MNWQPSAEPTRLPRRTLHLFEHEPDVVLEIGGKLTNDVEFINWRSVGSRYGVTIVETDKRMNFRSRGHRKCRLAINSHEFELIAKPARSVSQSKIHVMLTGLDLVPFLRKHHGTHR